MKKNDNILVTNHKHCKLRVLTFLTLYKTPCAISNPILSAFSTRVNAQVYPQQIQFVIHLRNFNNKFQGLVKSMTAESGLTSSVLLGRDLEIDFRFPDFNY